MIAVGSRGQSRVYEGLRIEIHVVTSPMEVGTIKKLVTTVLFDDNHDRK